MLKISELDTAVQVGSNERRIERENPLPLLAMLLLLQHRTQLAFWAASSPCQVISILPSISAPLLGKAAFDLFMPHTVLILEVALTLVQDLHSAKSFEIPMGSLLELFQVPLDIILSLRCTIQCGIICKVVEDVLNPFVYVIE